MFSFFYKNKVDKVVGTALVIIMSLMVLNVTWQVVSRYILLNPSAFTDELSRYMLIWLGMLGAAYVAGQDKHLAIDLLPQKLSGKPKQNLLIIINVVVIFFAVAVMVFGGLNLVYITYILNQKSATLQLPLSFIYTVIPLSGIIVTYYQIVLISSHLDTKNISA